MPDPAESPGGVPIKPGEDGGATEPDALNIPGVGSGGAVTRLPPNGGAGGIRIMGTGSMAALSKLLVYVGAGIVCVSTSWGAGGVKMEGLFAVTIIGPEIGWPE